MPATNTIDGLGGHMPYEITYTEPTTHTSGIADWTIAKSVIIRNSSCIYASHFGTMAYAWNFESSVTATCTQVIWNHTSGWRYRTVTWNDDVTPTHIGIFSKDDSIEAIEFFTADDTSATMTDDVKVGASDSCVSSSFSERIMHEIDYSQPLVLDFVFVETPSGQMVTKLKHVKNGSEQLDSN